MRCAQIEGSVHDTFVRAPYRSRFTNRDRDGRSSLLLGRTFCFLRSGERNGRPGRVALSGGADAQSHGREGSEYIEEGELRWMVHFCGGAVLPHAPANRDKHLDLVLQLRTPSPQSTMSSRSRSSSACSVSWLLDAISNQRVPEEFDQYLVPLPTTGSER